MRLFWDFTKYDKLMLSKSFKTWVFIGGFIVVICEKPFELSRWKNDSFIRLMWFYYFEVCLHKWVLSDSKDDNHLLNHILFEAF